MLLHAASMGRNWSEVSGTMVKKVDAPRVTFQECASPEMVDAVDGHPSTATEVLDVDVTPSVTEGISPFSSVLLRPSPLHRSVRKAKTQAMNLVVARSPSLLRGVLPEAILRSFGATIRAGATADEHGYNSSQPLPELAAFLSHSWHAPGRIKVAALFAYYNGNAAVGIGLACALLTSYLDSFRYLPSFEVDNVFLNLYLPGGPERIHGRFWCTVAYGIGYCIGLIFWQSILCRCRQIGRCGNRTPRGVFLDKVCIHQTDDARKRQGIAAIGAFLVNSRQMLILWDTTYFYRLWCVFEVAVYLSLKPNGLVTIVPITLYCAEVVLSMATCATMFGYGVGVCTGIVPAVISHISQWLSPLATLAWTMMASTWMLLVVMVLALRVFLRARLDMLLQLDTFSCDNAMCFAESDREAVVTTIIDLYGSPVAFDTFARNQVRKEVEEHLGPAVGLSYRFLLKILMPFAAGTMLDTIRSLEKAPQEYRRQWVVGFAAVLFFHLPAFAKFVELASRLELHTTTRFAEVAVSSFIAVACSGLGALMVCAWSYSLGKRILTNVISLVLGILAVLFAWRHDHKVKFDRFRHRQKLSDESSCSFAESDLQVSLEAPQEDDPQEVEKGKEQDLPQPAAAAASVGLLPDGAPFLQVVRAPPDEILQSVSKDDLVGPADDGLAPVVMVHAEPSDADDDAWEFPVHAERRMSDTDWTELPQVIGRDSWAIPQLGKKHRAVCCWPSQMYQ